MMTALAMQSILWSMSDLSKVPGEFATYGQYFAREACEMNRDF